MNNIAQLFDGLDDQTKVCRVCNQDLPLGNFCKASGGNYLRSECRTCEKELGRVRRLIKETAPSVPMDHACPICKRTEEQVRGRGGKKSGTWCCDHDHVTNKFRGWLCHDCNRAIGNFNDDINRLKKAINYLSS